VRSLSMVAAAIPTVGFAVADHDLSACRAAAEAARMAPSPVLAREAARTALG
jgi:phosphoenolpyruvate-protein phosphotransferase (PTS system enzyme I)